MYLSSDVAGYLIASYIYLCSVLFIYTYFSLYLFSHCMYYNLYSLSFILFFFFQAEDGIRDIGVTGVQTCALPISVLMRITDIFLAFPRLILALAFVAALGPGIENAVIAIAITSWPPYARIARAETLMIRNSDFIAAVKLQGASTPRIIFGHVVPLCISSVIVRVTLDMAGIILTAAGLGFLGLGAQPPSPEWGAMVATGRNYLIDQWWVAAVPGLAIFVVSLGFNLLGDGLRDVLDPKAAK